VGTRHRVAGRDDRAWHSRQGSGDVVAYRRRRGACTAVERHGVCAQAALVSGVAGGVPDWCCDRVVLAAAGRVVRRTDVLATVAGQGHRTHREQLCAPAPVVVVPAAGAGAVVAVAAGLARTEACLGRFVAWSLRTVPLVLVDRAIRRVLRDQRQADPLSVAAAAGMGTRRRVVVATTRCAPAAAAFRTARVARCGRNDSIAVAGGEDVWLPGTTDDRRIRIGWVDRGCRCVALVGTRCTWAGAVRDRAGFGRDAGGCVGAAAVTECGTRGRIREAGA